MNMLIYEYRHSIDQKGRLFIPVKLHDSLGNSFVLCPSFDENECLFAYSPKEWEKIEEQIYALPSKQAQIVRRRIFSRAAEIECDSQGRVSIPQKLREYAGLSATAVLIGSGSHVEIWSEERWDQYNSKTEEEAAESIMENIKF